MVKEFLNATGLVTAEFMAGPCAKLSKVEESDVLLQPLAGHSSLLVGWSMLNIPSQVIREERGKRLSDSSRKVNESQN